MSGRLYTLVIANRAGGMVRHLTFRRGPVATTVAIAVALPILIGLGARWSASAEIDRLRAANAALAIENSSYRQATGELTTQIQSLEGVVNELGERRPADAAAARGARKPATAPASTSAADSTTANSALSNVLSTISSPEDTFGALRQLLRNLGNRLRFARGETTPAK